MDLRKIKKLIDLLEESNLAELEIKEGEEVVRLSRVPKGSVTMAAPMAVAAPAVAAPAVTAVAPVAATPAAPTMPDGHVVKAPMVGTFYASASPGAAAFVKVVYMRPSRSSASIWSKRSKPQNASPSTIT